MSLLSYIFILHQTTTPVACESSRFLLSYIFILHQTTTIWLSFCRMMSCLISSFYIKPQLCMFSRRAPGGCLISSFYIKPQPGAQSYLSNWRCLISSFYIKPQLCPNRRDSSTGCLISSFYIKPQLTVKTEFFANRCLISSFYIKPQLVGGACSCYGVVLYLHSTSNHNQEKAADYGWWLSYIFILHQTTT